MTLGEIPVGIEHSAVEFAEGLLKREGVTKDLQADTMLGLLDA